MQDKTTQLMDGAKIMIVDDEPLSMAVLQAHLEVEGYKRFVCHAESITALDLIRHEQPSALILDLKMPNVSGFDILRSVRQDEDLEHLPVIVLTSSNDADSKLQSLQLGATDFLEKPVDSSELALRVRNALATRAYQQRLMHIDALTDLPNRVYFNSVTRDAIVAAARSTHQLALILINIARFKAVNDLHGPERGNDVLWAFSQRLRTAFDNVELCDSGGLCPDDADFFVSRVGGDRFAILLPVGSSDGETAELQSILQGLLAVIEKPFRAGDQKVHLSYYMGVSVLSHATESVESLLNQAETALVHAKRGQDLSFAFFSDQMDARARELLNTENDMRTAIENDHFFVVYQPKVDVKSGSIVGAEALVRWRRPGHGIVSPSNFIELAEMSGMIVPIGTWVLREACRQAVFWRACGRAGFKVAVNVSVRQLHAPDFIDIVRAVLTDTRLPPEALVLELTENMIMDDAEANIETLQGLTALGVSVSVDDFGTGYSSLSYLQQFPIDQLKIDRSFISKIKSADEAIPIVKAVMSLAHDLGLEVVAEGVETQAQLVHLQVMNCEIYQGFLYSKPLLDREFTALLMQDSREYALQS